MNTQTASTLLSIPLGRPLNSEQERWEAEEDHAIKRAEAVRWMRSARIHWLAEERPSQKVLDTD